MSLCRGKECRRDLGRGQVQGGAGGAEVGGCAGKVGAARHGGPRPLCPEAPGLHLRQHLLQHAVDGVYFYGCKFNSNESPQAYS